MKKYAFNHDANLLPETVGIAEERFDQLQSNAKETVIAAFFGDDNIPTNGHALEMLINKGQPTNEVEALLLGYMYGRHDERARSIAGKISKSFV